MKIGADAARRVFLTRTVPRYQQLTAKAFPGVQNLPADAQGALFSLVYNRGTSMEGEKRTEMRAIRDAVARGDLADIAKQLRAMKRLWIGKGLDGLLARRDAEADLVESCIAQ
jgi:GH24 family phage-related lysozyme (muramidase)